MHFLGLKPFWQVTKFFVREEREHIARGDELGLKR